MRKDVKKATSIAGSILTVTVVILAVIMMIFTVISVSTVDRQDRSIFGFKALTVLSDSMSKTDFSAGDLIFVKSVDPKTLEEGDIIAYRSTNPENFGATVTHKIRKLTVTESGEPGFVTYGTTTDTDDAKIVTYPYVIGKYQGHIAGMGKFFTFLEKPMGYVVCILIPFLILIVAQGINSINLFKKYKKEQLAEVQAVKDRERAELDAERAKIAAEQEEARKMLEELKALKEQMSGQQQPPEDNG